MRDDELWRAMDEAEAGRGTGERGRRLRETLAALSAFAPVTRGACPTRPQLVAWYDGALAVDEAQRLEAHLGVCPFCAADLADLEALSRPPVLEAVVALGSAGARLVRHSFRAATRPTPAPVRGEAAGALVLQADSDDVAVELTVDAGGPGTAEVRLRLRRAEPLERARINLLRDDQLLESRLAAVTDEILFADVPVGDYIVSVQPVDGDEVARVALRLEREA